MLFRFLRILIVSSLSLKGTHVSIWHLMKFIGFSLLMIDLLLLVFFGLAVCQLLFGLLEMNFFVRLLQF